MARPGDIGEEDHRREHQRALALEHLRPFGETLPAEDLERPYLCLGSEMFSLRRIIQEVEDDTGYGRKFVEMLAEHRLELAKRTEEFQDD